MFILQALQVAKQAATPREGSGQLDVTRTTVSGAARLDGPCSMRCATRVATPRYRQAAQARRNRTSEHVVPNRARQPRGQAAAWSAARENCSMTAGQTPGDRPVSGSS